MSPQQAKKIALLAIVVAAAATYMRQATGEGDASITRVVVGAIVVGMLLTAIADFAPEFAGPMAVLILTVALARTAPDLLKTLYPGR